jgi:amino-acid N-acetyltransferase
MDGEGHTYRVNSDSVALEVAKALGAVKLIFVTTADGLSVNGALARQVAVAELDKAIADGTVAPGQVSKARHAVAACHAGVPRVHVINGHVDEGLLAEVFSNEGIGTLIYANDYRQIRKAKKRDVRSIQQLIQASVESEELLPRSRAAIEKQLDDYYIFEVDKNPVACVALHPYPDTHQGELACLCVRTTHENQGVGRRMVLFVEDRARELGLKSLLALSTQAFNFFQSKAGFSEGTPDDLPGPRRERYDQSGRKSKVLVKSLAQESPAANVRAS